jgi:hypothetical protein
MIFQCIYGCTTNFTNDYTNMSLTYIYVTQLGNAVGQMTLPTITGKLVSVEPIWFGWMVLIVCVGCLIFELLVHLQGTIVLRKFKLSDTNQEGTKHADDKPFEDFANLNTC